MTSPVDIETLRRRLEKCPRLERRSLGRWLTRVGRMARKGRPVDRSFDRIAREIDRAVATRRARVAARSSMRLEYPEPLPVSAHREELLEVIRTHQVVVVCGETGSGKTTQLPKICLEAGRGIDGLIGHTQPRRVAAQSVAERLAEETGTELGGGIGWQVRFQKTQCAATCVKVMTDGILLAETPDDPSLDRYDTLIIDEAHERSLNIDFLLGYLCRLLARRPDLTLIITSATIDAERFSAHFGDCPVVEVSGRSHPVAVAYEPPEALELPNEEATSGAVIEAAITNAKLAGITSGTKMSAAESRLVELKLKAWKQLEIKLFAPPQSSELEGEQDPLALLTELARIGAASAAAAAGASAAAPPGNEETAAKAKDGKTGKKGKKGRTKN